MTARLSIVQRHVLLRAARRSDGYVCPTPGLHGQAQTAVFAALLREGFITDMDAPRITDAGREALATAAAERKSA